MDPADQVDHSAPVVQEDLVPQVDQVDQEAHSLAAPVDQVDHQALEDQEDRADQVAQGDQVG